MLLENGIFNEDKENMYWPYINEINVDTTCVQTPEPEIFKIIPSKEFSYEKSPVTDPYNAFYFKGSENMMFQQWVWSCEHICSFAYHWYPFDSQNCPIILNTTSPKVRMVGEDVYYTGSEEVGRYYFQNINFCDIDKDGRIGLYIDFTIKRPVLPNLITLFLPTGMLLIISQLSVVFKDLVIEVNTTLLLVLTT